MSLERRLRPAEFRQAYSTMDSRSKGLLLDYGFTFVSKGATFLILFVSLPAASQRLSVDDFSRLALMAALLSWSSVLNPTVGPEASVSIASSSNREVTTSAVRSHSVALGLVVSTLQILIVAPFLDLGTTGTPFYYSTVLALAVAMNMLGFVAESVRLGEQRASRSSVWSALAAITGVAMVLWAARTGSSNLLTYFVAMYMVPNILRATSLLDSKTSAWPLIQPREFRQAVFRRLLSNNLLHAIAQFANLMGYPLAILLFAATGKESMVGRLFILQTVTVVAINLIQSAIQPVAARVAEAIAEGDKKWVATLARRFARLSFLVATLGSALGATVGFAVLSLLFSELAPTRSELVVVGLSVGLSNAAAFMYQEAVGRGRNRAAAFSLIPGIVASIWWQVLAAFAGNIFLVVVGVGLVQPCLAIIFLRRSSVRPEQVFREAVS